MIAYTVGDAAILEVEGAEADGKKGTVFTRTLEVGKSSRDLLARIAPEGVAVAVVGDSRVSLAKQDGFHVLTIPAAATPTRVKVLMAKGGRPTSPRSPRPPPPRGRSSRSPRAGRSGGRRC